MEVQISFISWKKKAPFLSLFIVLYYNSNSITDLLKPILASINIPRQTMRPNVTASLAASWMHRAIRKPVCVCWRMLVSGRHLLELASHHNCLSQPSCHSATEQAGTQSPHASLVLSRSVTPVGLAGPTPAKQKEKELQFTGPLLFAIISARCFSCAFAGPCYHPRHSWQDSCPNRDGRMNLNAANILCQQNWLL